MVLTVNKNATRLVLSEFDNNMNNVSLFMALLLLLVGGDWIVAVATAAVLSLHWFLPSSDNNDTDGVLCGE